MILYFCLLPIASYNNMSPIFCIHFYLTPDTAMHLVLSYCYVTRLQKIGEEKTLVYLDKRGADFKRISRTMNVLLSRRGSSIQIGAYGAYVVVSLVPGFRPPPRILNFRNMMEVNLNDMFQLLTNTEGAFRELAL